MSRILYTFVAALAGGVFGWVGDGGHVLAGVLHYPKKDQLWWPGTTASTAWRRARLFGGVESFHKRRMR